MRNKLHNISSIPDIFNIMACRLVAMQRPRDEQLYNNRSYIIASKQQPLLVSG
jgi:hypothetical protein